MAYGFLGQVFLRLVPNAFKNGRFQRSALAKRPGVNFCLPLPILKILHFFNLQYLRMPAIVKTLGERCPISE